MKSYHVEIVDNMVKIIDHCYTYYIRCLISGFKYTIYSIEFDRSSYRYNKLQLPVQFCVNAM